MWPSDVAASASGRFGREFMGDTTEILKKHNVQVQSVAAGNHCKQGIVECFNRTLAQRLFGAEYAQKIIIAAHGFSERSTKWVKSFPSVFVANNDQKSRC